jgi:hypothetical protein
LGGEPVVVVITAGEEVGNQEEDPVKLLAFVEGRPEETTGMGRSSAMAATVNGALGLSQASSFAVPTTTLADT